jgi:hypothetical protein
VKDRRGSALKRGRDLPRRIVKGQVILNHRDSNEGKTGLLVAIDPADAPSPIKPLDLHHIPRLGP